MKLKLLIAKDISKTNNKILNLDCDKRNIDKEKKMLEENEDLIESKSLLLIKLEYYLTILISINKVISILNA